MDSRSVIMEPPMTLPRLPRPLQSWRPMRWVAIVSLLLGAACFKRLPPAPTPERTVPAVGSVASPQAGHGRLVVDVVDGPTPVHRVHMEAEPTTDDLGRTRHRFHEETTLLCHASPCVADLPTGNVLLSFPVVGKADAMETELVHIGAQPTVYRRSLSVHEGRRGRATLLGTLATMLGVASATTGVALLPTGLATGNDGMTKTGAITLGAGAALIAIGVLALRGDAATFRPGSSIHFPLP
jgi:hypothetical protein